MGKKRIRYETIVAAKNGDGMAMGEIVRHFAPLINRLSRETGVDMYGNHFDAINEEVRTLLEAKLISQIVLIYDINRLPPEKPK